MKRIVLQGNPGHANVIARRLVKKMGVDVEGVNVSETPTICAFNATSLYAVTGKGVVVSVLFNPTNLKPTQVPLQGHVIITTHDASRWGNETLTFLHDANFKIYLESDTVPTTCMFLLPPLPSNINSITVTTRNQFHCPSPRDWQPSSTQKKQPPTHSMSTICMSDHMKTKLKVWNWRRGLPWMQSTGIFGVSTDWF